MVRMNVRLIWGPPPRSSKISGREPLGPEIDAATCLSAGAELGAGAVWASAGAPASANTKAKINARISVPRLPSPGAGALLAACAVKRKLPDKLFHLQRFSTSSGARKRRV